LAGPLDTRQTSGAGVAGMILLWLVRSCARVVVRRFRWPQAIGRRTPLGCAAGQARGGSCFAWLPEPLLLRKAGLKGSGCDRRAAASHRCPGPYCSARRGLWARTVTGGQLPRIAALAPVAPQGGAKGWAATGGQLLRTAALAPVAPQGGA